MALRSINSLSFIHDRSGFVCCTKNGVKVYNISDRHMRMEAMFDFGSVLKCEILNPTYFIAIIYGRNNARYVQNIVMIFNVLEARFVADIVCATAVKSVLMRRDLLIVVTMDKICIFTFPLIRHIISLETCINPKGLCVLTTDQPFEDIFTTIIAYPGSIIGSIEFMEISYLNMGSTTSSPSSRINAHEGEVSCLAINVSGTLIASANSNGTIIRIWDIILKVKVVELRRGLDTLTLYCMNFSLNSELLCCSNDKGKIDIYIVMESNLNPSGQFPLLFNRRSYSQSQKALATFNVISEVGCIVTFLTLKKIMAICLDGTCQMFDFSMNGSVKCTSLQAYLFN